MLISNKLLEQRRWATHAIDSSIGKPKSIINAWGINIGLTMELSQTEPPKSIDNGKRFVCGNTLIELEEQTGRLKERIIVERGAKPQYVFTLESSKQLEFSYQDALTEDEIKEGVKRPEEIVGSYAVFHNRRKVAHIYRPWVKDDKGDTAYCDMRISGNKLFVELDQRWLNRAKYPIVIDPTIGYTDIGATATGFQNAMYCFGYYPMLESGSLQSIHHYVSSRFGGGIWGMYSDNGSNHPGSLFTYSVPYPTVYDQMLTGWNTIPCSGDLTINNYWLFCFPAVWTSARYDSYGGVALRYKNIVFQDPPPDPAPAGMGIVNNRAYSVYVTYEEITPPAEAGLVPYGISTNPRLKSSRFIILEATKQPSLIDIQTTNKPNRITLF